MAVNLFDANFYRAANSDLAGLNDSQALAHFQNYGLDEGRAFSPLVNLSFYRSSNSDLASLNNRQAFEHLQNFGIAEGRSFSPFANLSFYKNVNTDLASLNNEQAFEHLQNFGVAEGRTSSPYFNVSYYRSNYADLAGFNYKQAYDHFVLQGLNQGRFGTAPPTSQWTQQFGTASEQSNNDVKVDSAGNIYVTGRTTSLDGLNIDIFVAKYNSNGNQQWLKQFGTAFTEFSESLTVDSAGNVYVTGETLGSLGGANAGSRDAWVVKYDTNGNQQWLKQFGTAADDYSYSIAVDSTGNVYITGQTGGSLARPIAGSSDAWLGKYDTNGNRQWLKQFGTSSYDSSKGVAVDSAGSVYLTGYTGGSLGGTNAGGTDAWVAKYTTSGNRQWLKQFGTNADDFSNNIAIDRTGNIYLTGGTNSATSPGDGFVTKYNSAGNRQWIHEFDTRNIDTTGIDLAVDSAGSVYVLSSARDSRGLSGDISLLKYDTNGYRLGTQYDTDYHAFFTNNGVPTGIAIDSNNNLYLAGSIKTVSTEGEFNTDAWLTKYSQLLGVA